jgi:hypothetical protein
MEHTREDDRNEEIDESPVRERTSPTPVPKTIRRRTEER